MFSSLLVVSRVHYGFIISSSFLVRFMFGSLLVRVF